MSDYQTYLDKCRYNRSVGKVVFVRLPCGGLRTFDEDAYVVRRITGIEIRLTRETTLDVEADFAGWVVERLTGAGFEVEIASPVLPPSGSPRWGE